MSNASWKNAGSVVVDWLDSKQAKTLRVTNERESFQLNKLRRTLDSMKNLNDNLLTQEEKKVKKNLAKLSEVSPPHGMFRNLYKKPMSLATIEKQREAMLHGSVKSSIESPGGSDHLPKFASFLRQPTKTTTYEKKKSKGFMPFSSVDLYMTATAPKPPVGYAMQEQKKINVPTGASSTKHPNGFRGNAAQGSTVFYRKGSYVKKLPREDSSVSIQEAIQIFPSLQKIVPATGRNFSQDKSQLHKAMSGFPAFERRLKELLVKAWEEEERSQREASLPNIRPEEVLRCRYLRLSQNNINTLLKLCEDSGMHVGIHPHMKESDIDINTVMSSANNTISL